jgi:hypothetical protein
VKLTAVVLVLLQTVWLEMLLTVGMGFTVIVNVCEEPEHPFAEGVTVIVPDMADVPVFLAVNEEISPVPLDASPMEVLLFVQL